MRKTLVALSARIRQPPFRRACGCTRLSVPLKVIALLACAACATGRPQTGQVGDGTDSTRRSALTADIERLEHSPDLPSAYDRAPQAASSWVEVPVYYGTRPTGVARRFARFVSMAERVLDMR
jgi:hypothetical protein